MKNIMLRDLKNKKDVADIVEAYMKRPSVDTTSASTAIEQMIRQFDRDESANRQYRQQAEAELERLRDKVARLTLNLGAAVRQRRAFVAALQDLTSED